MSIVSPVQLRDYQIAGDNEVRDHIRAGRKRILIVAPTGAGKGTHAADIVRRAAAKGKRVIFAVYGREIVEDFSRNRLDRLGVDHGVIMANHPRRRPQLHVHVASIDTLRRRLPPPADLVIVDECDIHFSAWLKLRELYPEAIIIGTTATPVRQDGRGLGELFEAMVEWPSPSDLMDRGFLVRPKLYGPAAPDLSGVHKTAGEFNQRELAAAVDRPVLVGGLLETWLKLRGPEVPSAAFGVDCAHARHIQEEFVTAGYRWDYVDGETDSETRQKMWGDLRTGKIHGVASVGVIGRGWDLPELAHLIDAAPTASLAKCLQRWGRVLRSAPGKARAIIQDHAGNYDRHGWPDDVREWSLEGRLDAKRDEEAGPSIRLCKKCFLTYPASAKVCPECGTPAEVKEREIEHVDGDLEEISRESVAKALLERIRHNPKFKDLVEWRVQANERGYKRGYPVVRYRQAHGEFPPRGWSDAAALLADGVTPAQMRGGI